ncbi:MAG TPA: aldo/keto reductase [Acidimicrobiaceae bacterium]|nr:aldo/keto reductase [Acidimicrobiaceae bacterium]HCB37223.1 aldo/keto reductase [Acidimicrobiaceae bacterium]
MWRFTTDDVDAAATLVETAVDAGMNLVDNADVYGFDWGGSGFGACEELLGRVLAARPGLRDRIVLATKGGIVPPLPYDSGPDALRRACEASLRRMGVERIDLYQVHRPDVYTHPAEVAATLDALVADGKVGAVGVSNYTAAQTDALAAHLTAPLATTQPEFSAVVLEPLRDGTLDLCARIGVVPLAWSPLAGGRLASGDDVAPELVAVLDRLAGREGVDRAAIAVAFVLAHPTAPVAIVGSQQPARLAALARATDVVLDRNDVYDIVEASDGVPLP